MRYLPISKIPLVEEATASGEVAETYNMIRSFMGTPTVGVADQAAANSPAVLAIYTELFHRFLEQTILPHPLLFMMHYTISVGKKCVCCSANFKHACQSVGIDEVMLEAVINNLDAVSPQRTREIIRFSVKCALEPLTLTEADYDNLRNQGVTEQELVEITFWASLAMLNDTFADSLKLKAPSDQQLLEV